MLASIDIGTNSVRLFIGKLIGGHLVTVKTQLITTRLGQDVNTSGMLNSEAMKRTYMALEVFQQVLNDYDLEKIVVIATSAVRDAINQKTFIDTVKHNTGWEVLVLSGEEEAQASFVGVVKSLTKIPMLQNLIVLDVGGGSTELIYGLPSGTLLGCGSAQIGAVRLTELCSTNLKLMQNIARDRLQPLVHTIALDKGKPFTLIGVGGTITTLASLELGLNQYQADAVMGYQMHKIVVEDWLRRLVTMDLASKTTLPGMPTGREDIIVAGVVVISTIMDLLDTEQLIVSDADLLQGIIYLNK